MKIEKIRFIEPGSPPYRPSIKNLYTYEKYIRTPSHGLLTLATIAKAHVDDTYMYSESISKIKWDDVLDADIVFIGVFTFAASRGYELARYIKERSEAVVVMGGLHASMNYPEAVQHCDYVLLGEGDESIPEFIAALREGRQADFPGVAYLEGGVLVHTGDRKPPEDIDVIPDRDLLYRYREMAGHNTIWPQVHASRGCPHNCDYCAVVRHLGRKVRTRSPENVVEDIKRAIAFHGGRRVPRMMNILWITDDNFFADRDWALSVLNAIIDSGINYNFTIQTRYEVGFDDEMLDLMKRAGFCEVAMGIEFLEDESFEAYHKKSLYTEIIRSVKNIQKHGLNVRGLFIFGADDHTKGVGDRLADFVIEYDIRGVLIQSMYFVPGTPVYEANKGRLLDRDWSKYDGHVVHDPKLISAYDLQKEIIRASAKIYSVKNVLKALVARKGAGRVLYLGECLWQMSVRADLRRDLKNLPREVAAVDGDAAPAKPASLPDGDAAPAKPASLLDTAAV
ncbi:MAG: B12-binding domain-containing radical SAM protein [Clostridiales bacterium]|nr:B12-binding domain-containing radical SAM protein [Clostridiales bacterium]